MTDEPRPWPTEVRLPRTRDSLMLSFADQDGDERVVSLSAEFLRVHSPSAEVRGHGAGDDAKLVTGKRAVQITSAEAVGSYAVRLIFSDGHATGIFTWDYLARLADEKTAMWQAYVAALEAAGAGRD